MIVCVLVVCSVVLFDGVILISGDEVVSCDVVDGWVMMVV